MNKLPFVQIKKSVGLSEHLPAGPTASPSFGGVGVPEWVMQKPMAHTMMSVLVLEQVMSWQRYPHNFRTDQSPEPSAE